MSIRQNENMDWYMRENRLIDEYIFPEKGDSNIKEVFVNPQCPYCATTFTPQEGRVCLRPKLVTAVGLDGIKRTVELGTTSKTRLQCPNCKAIMRNHTGYMTATMSVQDYGKYVYLLKKWDVDHKVKFDLILQWAKANYVKSAFWEGYLTERSKDPDWLARHPQREVIAE